MPTQKHNNICLEPMHIPQEPNTGTWIKCVDATGVDSHQLGLLGTDLHAVSCGGFVETLN